MRVAVGFDHAGLPLREVVIDVLERGGHELIDCGTSSADSVDYPLHGAPAARLVADGEADAAVLACGSGTGMSIVANKLAGVRALNARDPEEAEMARRHNDANVLALAGRRLGRAEAASILEAFLSAPFEGGRHARRVDQITAVEAAAVEAGSAPDREGARA